jgi:glycosyltransferase involved in cell wall biosynthesis
VKLLHVMSACTVGGCEQHVLALLSRLDPARYERWLAYFVERPDEARPMLPYFQAIGVQTVDLRGRGQLDPRAMGRLRTLLRRERFDLVHVHSFRAEVAMAVATTALFPHPRIIRTVHNVEDYHLRFPTSLLSGLSGSSLDRVVAISDAVAEHLKTSNGASSDRIRRIYYGLDLEPFLAAERPRPASRPPTIGVLARLAPQKGHPVLLRALPRVVERFPDVRVVIAGHEHLTTRAQLESEAEALGVRGNVEIVGYRDDVPAFMSEIDLFVLPSLWEGVGLVLLEAMAAGKPVVATRVGPVPEIVQDGETGLLVPAGEPERLANAILEILEQPSLGRRLGRAGRIRCAERFSLDRMVAETEALYDEVLAEQRPRTTPREAVA